MTDPLPSLCSDISESDIQLKIESNNLYFTNIQ